MNAKSLAVLFLAATVLFSGCTDNQEPLQNPPLEANEGELLEELDSTWEEDQEVDIGEILPENNEETSLEEQEILSEIDETMVESEEEIDLGELYA